MKNKQTIKVLVFGMIVLLGALVAFGLLPSKAIQGRLKQVPQYQEPPIAVPQDYTQIRVPLQNTRETYIAPRRGLFEIENPTVLRSGSGLTTSDGYTATDDYSAR